MQLTIQQYITKVKSHLCHNNSEEDNLKYGYFTFTDRQIDDNIDYFRRFLEEDISPYIALEQFYYFLDGNLQLK